MSKNTKKFLERFHNFIVEHKLFDKADRILVGISGGADSVALLDLLYSLGYDIAAVHCNFLIRGKEAFRDELFVKNLTQKYDIKLYVKKCSAVKHSTEKGISVEMAARDLRYNYFNELIKKYHYDWIAVAHNADDNIETILLNLARKTGIKGLLGIPIKRDKIVRPLLFAHKNDILNYCRENNLEFVEDSTNSQNIYARNKVRNQIIPLFEQINKNFKNNVLQTIENLKEIYNLYLIEYHNFINQCIENDKYLTKISIECLKKQRLKNSVLIEFLHSYGFCSSDIKNIIKSLNSQPGKIFYSENYKLLRDRKFLLIQKKTKELDTEYTINSHQGIFEFNKDKPDYIRLKINKITAYIKEIKKDKNIAYFDYDKLKFPLVLRKHRPGDYFYPFGMKGKKKLSDFFNDNKISRFQKSNIWLLLSGDEIIWVIGYRSSEHYKITSKTKNILIIEKL